MKRGKRAYRKIILYALGIEMSSLFLVAFETKKGSATKKAVAVHEAETMASRISSLLIIRLKNAAKIRLQEADTQNHRPKLAVRAIMIPAPVFSLRREATIKPAIKK